MCLRQSRSRKLFAGSWTRFSYLRPHFFAGISCKRSIFIPAPILTGHLHQQSSNHFCPYSEKEPAPQHGSPLLPQGTLRGYFHSLLLGYSHSFGGHWELQGPFWRCCESWHVVSASKLVGDSMVANGYVAIWFSAVVLDGGAVALCPRRRIPRD